MSSVLVTPVPAIVLAVAYPRFRYALGVVALEMAFATLYLKVEG